MAKRKTVLVVDDSRTMRLLIKSNLTDAGYTVLEAESGEEGLALLQANVVDLVTLDIEMPGMNGYETCSAIRAFEATEKKSTSLPIVMLTAHDSIEGREKGFAAGATNFITKSAHANELISRIKMILEPAMKYAQLGVLVIEDSNLLRRILVSTLDELNLRVMTADDGQEGLEFFKRYPGKIDMILTGVYMPKMNGEEFCRKIRNELSFKSLPIVVITGDETANKAIDLFKAEATEYIRRPFLKEEFLARISVHLDKILLERDLRTAIAELREANELRDRFLGICSHDMRSPLTGIAGCAAAVAKSAQLNDLQKKMMQTIEVSAQDVLALVTDLLELSKLKQNSDAFEMAPLKLDEELATCVSQQKSIANKKEIALNFNCGDSDPRVLGNASALKRVANNLLSNAIKFTPRGGRIDVELSNPEPGKLLLMVRDTGMGIPPDKLNQVFDMFTKAGRKGTEGEGSTGLGLSIVKEIVEKHGSRIDVTSQVGKGTTFSMVFSKVKQPA